MRRLLRSNVHPVLISSSFIANFNNSRVRPMLNTLKISLLMAKMKHSSLKDWVIMFNEEVVVTAH